jgi:hypothetical protein
MQTSLFSIVLLMNNLYIDKEPLYTSFESTIEISVTIKRIIGGNCMNKMTSEFWIADQQA